LLPQGRMPASEDPLEKLTPWTPAGIIAVGAPVDKPPIDQRWRVPRAQPHVPEDKRLRAQRAVGEQCMNARVPGYTGFIPSQKAEDIYGRTQAAVGHGASQTQIRHAAKREAALAEAFATMQERSRAGTPVQDRYTEPAPDYHPLGKSKADVVRNHWVPTIPGYGGFVPAKHAENIVGGGIIQTCQLAGRAIAERAPLPDPPPAVTQQDEMSRSRLLEHFHAENSMERPEYRAKHVARLRDHCEKQIPGYMGHVPRVKGESICGATARGTNNLAAEYVEDRIYNPQNHINMCCQPQVPLARKLRL